MGVFKLVERLEPHTHTHTPKSECFPCAQVMAVYVRDFNVPYSEYFFFFWRFLFMMYEK